MKACAYAIAIGFISPKHQAQTLKRWETPSASHVLTFTNRLKQ